jgi:hypothetical protein
LTNQAKETLQQRQIRLAHELGPTYTMPVGEPLIGGIHVETSGAKRRAQVEKDPGPIPISSEEEKVIGFLYE